MRTFYFWLAVFLSASFHVAPLAAFVTTSWWPFGTQDTPPVLLEAYGDSDRAGFPDVEAVAMNPGAYREADDHTPGGDDAQPEPLPRETPAVPPALAEPEPARESPAREPDASASSATRSTKPAPEAPSGSGLPGAPGGAKMPLGTPSAGGTVGTLTGVRLVGAARPPVYPPEAQAKGIEGRPIVWLKISTEGLVVEVKLHRSSGHKILDDAALRYVQALRFVPARRGNTPIEWEALKAVNYYLE